ncbi:MAG: hypothetical protein IPO48_06375 [Saprospiraceae bacterium]|nr:hypothetical protein [Saprospiraceae bacterium]
MRLRVSKLSFCSRLNWPPITAGCNTAPQNLACDATLPAAKVLSDFNVADACVGGVTLHSVVTNPVSGTPANRCSATVADRTVTRTYTFRDACNNETTCIETFVFAQDQTGPSITDGCNTAPQNLACDATLPAAKVLSDFNVTDACVGGVTLHSVVTNPVSGTPANRCSATVADRTVTRTYTFRDACNNETTCIETFVFAQDQTGPSITDGCNTAPQNLACDATLPAAKVLSDFNVTDACVGGVTLHSVVTNPVSGTPANRCSATVADRTVTRTYTFRDACNNETT